MIAKSRRELQSQAQAHSQTMTDQRTHTNMHIFTYIHTFTPMYVYCGYERVVYARNFHTFSFEMSVSSEGFKQ